MTSPPPSAAPAASSAGEAGAPSPSAAAPASAPSQRFEAEDLAGAQRVDDPSASGGAAASAAELSIPVQVTPGTYLLSASVKSPHGGRIDLTVDGAMVASYQVSGAWTVLSAAARAVPGSEVGLRSIDPAGHARDTPVEVDWLAVDPTAPATTVKGNQMLGPDGTAYVPKGLNFPFVTGDLDPSGAIRLTDPPVDDVYVWGADALRIQLNQEYWLSDCPVVLSFDRATRYRAAVADAVASLTARGVHVFLSLLATEHGEATGCAPATRPWLKEMADGRSPAFWTSVASTFGSNPLVIFDLFNEPHDISKDVWLRGGSVSYPTRSAAGVPTAATFDAVGMQQLYDAVRSTGTTNLISVSGPSWATDPRVMLELPLDGYGIVVGTHAYCSACAPFAPQLNPKNDVNNDPTVLDRFPFVITEAGWKNPPDPRYSRDVIDWAASRGVGYLMYAFYVPGDYSLVKSWDETFDAGGALTKEPNRSGRPVWNDFAPTRTARGFAANLLPET
jgi:hypothetical protein